MLLYSSQTYLFFYLVEFLKLIKILFELDICSKQALLKWENDTLDNKFRGKLEARQQLCDWLATI